MSTQQLAAGLPENIAVNSMCPGWCRTEMGGPEAPLSADKEAGTLLWLALEAPRETCAAASSNSARPSRGDNTPRAFFNN